MSRPNSPQPAESPNLLSLVLHSKKALQHGEQLCLRARDVQRKTTDVAVDVLALDAKVKWISQGIQGQLKLAAALAKSIELQRNRLEQEAKHWDKSRALHSGNLDSILESLATQLVPPDFYQSSSSSSLFGSPHPEEEDEPSPPEPTVPDRSKWKTLRDFVDERGVEDAVELVENERQALDDTMALTEDHSTALMEHVDVTRGSLPEPVALPSIKDIFAKQESDSARMAHHLESLTSHYDQMAGALKDHEAGEEFGEDDLQEMIRDTDELPSIVAELEEHFSLIESSYNQLLSTKDESQSCLDQYRKVLDYLDELGDVMGEMLDQQQKVEADCQNHFATLQAHLSTLEDLHTTYTSYQMSYNSLLLEMERRKRFVEANDILIQDMMKRLELLREEEIQARKVFDMTHGPNLPDDLCLSITNFPTQWEVVPAPGESLEVLPEIADDLLIQARKHVDLAESISL